MTELDYQPGTTQPQIETTCEKIRERMMMVVAVAEPVLQQVRNLVRGNKSAIVAELGAGNAQALQGVYNGLKAAVEAGKDTVIDELPEA